ncbi:MAG: hypothetical protein LBL96_11310 [Clostridiales bacterium]|nr:hypothetical protein [Clostridiales bacterium]
MAKLKMAQEFKHGITPVEKRRSFWRSLRSTEAGEDITDMDLDTEISLLLEQDRKVSATVPDLDEMNLVPEFTVFDRERRSLEDALKNSQPEQQPITTEGDGADYKTRKQLKIAIMLAGLCVVFGTCAMALAFSMPVVTAVIQGETITTTPAPEDRGSDGTNFGVNPIRLKRSPIIENLTLRSGVIGQDGVSLTFSLAEGSIDVASSTKFYLFNQAQKVSAKHGTGVEATAAVREMNNEKLLDVEFSRLIGGVGPVTLIIKGMVKRTQLNIPLETGRLFNFAEQGESLLEVGDINVILEGMDYNRDNIVLVLHGEIKGASVHVPVVAFADLTMSTASGDEVVIRGACQYNDQGTDVRFMLPNNSNLNLDPLSMSLTLNAIETPMPDVNFIIHY